MSAQDGMESVAKMMVSQYARTVLYPTDTPVVRPQILASLPAEDGTSLIIANTNLPDGVIYLVTRESPSAEPILAAFKKLEDMQVH